jgi:hypothetical protein
MTCETDPIAPRAWVAIDIAKGLNVALVEHAEGRQQRFRFVHQRDDYDRLVEFLRGCLEPCRIALQPTAAYRRHHRRPPIAHDEYKLFSASKHFPRMREPCALESGDAVVNLPAK